MADFDPLTVPAVMPVTVRRTNEQGFPRQALLDYEQALQGWMKANVANTNTRLNLVSEEVDGAYAAVATEAIARAAGDSALAAELTTLETTVGDNTAELAILSASIDGIAVKYAVTGTINGVTGGFVLTGIQQLGGGASYLLEITSDVVINGNLLVTGTVETVAVASHAISQVAFSASGGINTGVGITVRTGATVAVTASFNGLAGTYFPLSASPGTVYVERDGVLIGSVATNFEASGSGSSAGISFLQTTVLCQDSPGGGYHDYIVHSGNGAGVGGVAILVQELAR
jgi:hypothetical protein